MTDVWADEASMAQLTTEAVAAGIAQE